jgi:hypothetical protein
LTCVWFDHIATKQEADVTLPPYDKDTNDIAKIYEISKSMYYL